MNHLCITVRWLDHRYHGLLDRSGPPEWPPSPFRLLQALVAGVARRGELDSVSDILPEWLTSLEKLGPPIIISPRSCLGRITTRFVPNNDGDQVPDRQNRLTAKTSRPMIMLDSPEIHYLWHVPENSLDTTKVIEAARCLSCFGLGIDMAYASAQLTNESKIGKLRGIRWFPKLDSMRDEGLLRVPVEGTVADLLRAHRSVLNRIEDGKPLRTIDRPRVFDEVAYAGSEQPLGLPHVTFALRTYSGEFFRYPHAKLIHIAGMTRNAAIKAMEAYPPENVEASWVETVIAGHRSVDSNLHKQFSYIPLSSIGHEHADADIRRVMLVAPFGEEAHLSHLAEQLEGEELTPEYGEQGPVLERIRKDGVTRQYLESTDQWATVTPVILPGHDDHKPGKTERLIKKALLQSGVDAPCTFTWSAVPNFKNSLSAYRHDRQGKNIGYFRPGHLQSLTAVHLRLRFQTEMAGPLCIGAGRHYGLGLLARIDAGSGRA